MHPSSSLFDECMQILRPEVATLSQKETHYIFNTFEHMFPVRLESRVSWEEVPRSHYQQVHSRDNIFGHLCRLIENDIDTFTFILWNDGDLSVVVTSLYKALQYTNDITCVAPDTWFLNIRQNYIVEFFHEGEIVVGRSPHIENEYQDE